jgi:hypothetical protein
MAMVVNDEIVIDGKRKEEMEGKDIKEPSTLTAPSREDAMTKDGDAEPCPLPPLLPFASPRSTMHTPTCIQKCACVRLEVLYLPRNRPDH